MSAVQVLYFITCSLFIYLQDELTRYRTIYNLLCQGDTAVQTQKLVEFVCAQDVPDDKLHAVVVAVKAIDVNNDGSVRYA